MLPKIMSDLSYEQAREYLKNLCTLYAEVGLSENTDQFAILQDLIDNDWKTYIWSKLTYHPSYNFDKMSKWTTLKFGVQFDPINTPDGVWLCFRNKTGSCTDQIFAFQHDKDYQEFRKKWK